MESNKKISERPNGSIRVQSVIPEHSKVDPSFKNSADVNNIIAKYKKTQLWPGRQLHASHMDWYSIPDLKTAMDVVARAQSMFNELPAHVRSRFKNDPSNLLDFIRDPKNQNEAAQLGLANPSFVPASNDDDSTTTMSGNPTAQGLKPTASQGAPAPQPKSEER